MGERERGDNRRDNGIGSAKKSESVSERERMKERYIN
jgi:hypothetical protein